MTVLDRRRGEALFRSKTTSRWGCLRPRYLKYLPFDYAIFPICRSSPTTRKRRTSGNWTAYHRQCVKQTELEYLVTLPQPLTLDSCMVRGLFFFSSFFIYFIFTAFLNCADHCQSSFPTRIVLDQVWKNQHQHVNLAGDPWPIWFLSSFF